MKKAGLYVLLFSALTVIPNLSALGGNEEGSGNGIRTEKIISTFEIQSIQISKEGLVSWTASEEHGSLPYIVEQYIFDKWVRVGEVEGIGTSVPNSYSVPVILSSGENKFRVRQKGFDKMNRFSEAVSFYSKKHAINYSLNDKKGILEFSDDTYFIIYNPYGSVIKQGYGNSLDISNYATGYYCLIYDNKLGGFEKKKVLFKNSFCPIVVKSHLFRKKKLK